MSHLARACPSWRDDLWPGSTPIECGRSRQTNNAPTWPDGPPTDTPRPAPAFFWGLRLHLIATPSGLPIAYALTPAAADERDTCTAMIEHNRLTRPAQTLIADKGYRRAGFEQHLQTIGITLIRPTLKTEPPRPHQQFLKPFRQIIESIIHTLKTQLGLERHGARTKPGVTVRVLQRLLALTAVIWHNETTQQPGPARSLTPYDH